jgi:hypothetical protein
MARTYQFEVGPVVELLDRILQTELAAVCDGPGRLDSFRGE